MHLVTAKFMPHLLSEEQKENHVSAGYKHQERLGKMPDPFRR